jgi:type II secretory pathway component GspD/PulD (secretin)
VSLHLPDASEAELLAALQGAYGIGMREENGAKILGSGGEFFETRTVRLQNLTPDEARLLFPDFLLPFLRADRESNALLVSQTAPMAAKIAADLAKLDVPRAQFEIEVQAWELSDVREVNQTLNLTRSIGGDSQVLDFGTGTASVRVETGQTNRLSATLNALSQRGRARLRASPRVTALSGERGNLFLGQTRYIQVLQNRFGGQSAQALALQIGTTLGVTPRGNGQGGDILLDIAPRVSSIDDIEARTGLPTLGIRESNGTIRVGDGDSLILAGLDFDLDAKTKRKTLGILPSKREAGDERALLVLVTAKRVGSGGKSGE